jgi:hypothetical protein
MPGVSLLRGLLPFFCVFFGTVFFFFAIVIYSFLEAPDPPLGSEALNGYIKKPDLLSTTATDRTERCNKLYCHMLFTSSNPMFLA